MAHVIVSLGHGVYKVEHDGVAEIVYVAGPANDRWVFWKGQVFRGDLSQQSPTGNTVTSNRPGGPDKLNRARPALSLMAPMPARVSRILVQPGANVKKGDTLIVLEAMKMELPLRAPADAAVTAIHCQEGELVQADAVLLDLASS
jgi:biotin carboxyl carrier protein